MVGGACRAAGNLPVWTLMTVHWWPVTFTGGFSLCPTCVYSRHNQQRLLCSRQQLLPNTWPAIFPHVCSQALEPIQSVQLRRVGAKCKVERAVKWNFPFWHAGICWEDRSLVTLLTMLQEEAPPPLNETRHLMEKQKTHWVWACDLQTSTKAKPGFLSPRKLDVCF